MLTKKEVSVLEKFRFNLTPVGVSFPADKPEGLPRLKEKMALCEMLKRAQEGEAFFADRDSHTCEAGLHVLGQEDASGPFVSGKFGAGLKIFEGPRAASRLYRYLPRIGNGVADYVAFSPLNKLSFDPDVLVVLAEADQTEILLRALSYKNGKMWSSKFSAAIGCAWVLVYPYITGELNYTVTGLGHGMKRRKLFPEGKQLVSIPFDLLSPMLQTLQEMPWVLPAYKPDGMEFVGGLLRELGIGAPKKKRRY
ncbi:MAG: DUF169 domain-containing protein [Deltaproteobacteria bacterium]|nr:DUF169 domain-containing protein [Deltaproteobacteria bacterium]